MRTQDNIPNDLNDIFSRYYKKASTFGGDKDTNRTPKSPKYLIQCPGIFSSSIQGYTNASICDEFIISSEKKSNHDVTIALSNNNILMSSSHIIIKMRNGEWGPTLENLMLQGITIPTITIYRVSLVFKVYEPPIEEKGDVSNPLSSCENELKPLLKCQYFTCSIQSFKSFNDYIELEFKFLNFHKVFFKYDQQGKLQGQSVTSFNYSELQADAKTITLLAT